MNDPRECLLLPKKEIVTITMSLFSLLVWEPQTLTLPKFYFFAPKHERSAPALTPGPCRTFNFRGCLRGLRIMFNHFYVAVRGIVTSIAIGIEIVMVMNMCYTLCHNMGSVIAHMCHIFSAVMLAFLRVNRS